MITWAEETLTRKSVIRHYSQFFVYPTTSQIFCKSVPQSSTPASKGRNEITRSHLMEQRRAKRQRTRSELSESLVAAKHWHTSRVLSLFFCFIPSSFMTTFSHLSLHLHLHCLHFICSSLDLFEFYKVRRYLGC